MRPEVLSSSQLETALIALKGWEYSNNKISKTFLFADFKKAFTFMLKVAFEAEKLNHHPDWRNVYNQVYIELSTHDKGGITQLDTELATIINKLFDHGF